MKKGLKKIWHWIDDRSGISSLVKPLMNHPVPPGSKWSYVFGSATLFCLILQIVTGVGLALMYQPSSDKAFQSLQFITHQAIMGRWLRGLHYFGATGMILMVGIHMVRVYITAAYKYPREMNWISGVVLLILTVGMGFTGQLLRWDDNGVWSGVVAAEQLGRVPLIGKYLARLLMGGNTIGGQTLSRFFAYHVFLIPGLILLFVSFHLYLVLRNGISEPPKAGRLVDPATYRRWYENLLKENGIPFWPYAAWRDVVFGVLVLLAIIVLAYTVGPPSIGQQPDPSVVYTKPKPDWYLLWIYALYALMPKAIESYAIFFGPIVVFGLLFALPFLSKKGERSPIKRPWSIIGVTGTVVIIATLLVVGNQSAWSPHFKTKVLPFSVVQSSDVMVQTGSKLFYDKGCLYCHKIDDYGGLTGPDLTFVGRRLSEQELQIRIINGGDNMPAYGQSLSSEELNQIVLFLETRK
ncbi:MAG: cytochrome b N-terminal domain-containing protein [Flavisolibacter sp.]